VVTDRAQILMRRIGLALVFVAGVALFYFSQRYRQQAAPPPTMKVVRVMSYSAFVNSWGPGPEIAKRYESQYGSHVEFQDAGDAGLILQKLELFPADVVLGLDQFAILDARARRKWRQLEEQNEFSPLDQGAISFIYRKDEVKPPTSLADLLDPRFKGGISLEDPGTSSTGLQFFFWVLDSMGVEPGFSYLKNLKVNLAAVSPSWSTAYGLFTKKQAKLACSYQTSPVYHWTQEQDRNYQAAVFSDGQPEQIEYIGVPESCKNCEDGERFAKFLKRPEIQKIIMEKNYMMPVTTSVAEGSLFSELPKTVPYHWKDLQELLKNRDALLKRWRQLDL
jgi:thiamine transport system substrate-binding protein